MGKLDGKVAIVTGAARGLGRAYAKRLAGLGAKVVVADLNLHSYEEFEAEAKDMTVDSTVAEIEASGGAAIGIEMDVRDHAAVEAMAARVSRSGVGSMYSSRMQAVVVVAPWIRSQHPRSGALAPCDGDEPVWDGVFLQRSGPDHETAAVGKDHHGKLSGRDRTVC